MGYGRAMAKYAVFTGRASRSEYWGFNLVFFLALLVGVFIDTHVAGGANGRQANPIYVILIALPHLLPAMAVQVRRLHDTNRSGALILLNIFPLFSLLLLAWSVGRGTVGPNRYGPDPLQPAALAQDGQPVASNGLASPSTAAASPRDLIAELERLSALKASGSLSEAEFDVMKARALSRA